MNRSSIDPVPIPYVPDTNTGSIHDWWIVAQPVLVKLKPKIKIEYNRENGLTNDNNNDEEEFTQLNSQAKK